MGDVQRNRAERDESQNAAFPRRQHNHCSVKWEISSFHGFVFYGWEWVGAISSVLSWRGGRGTGRETSLCCEQPALLPCSQVTDGAKKVVCMHNISNTERLSSQSMEMPAQSPAQPAAAVCPLIGDI